MLKFYFLFAILFLPTLSKGQRYFKKTRIESQLGFISSTTKNTPFLLRSNQYGLVPLESQVGFVSGNVLLEYDSLFTQSKKLKPFGFGFGFTPHINFGGRNQILFPEAYAKVRFKSFEFYAGRRREIQGLVDTLGTMGSYIWSGNALPLPKVEISIPNYTPILGNGLVSIKGNFAHGWFGKGDSVQNVLLHQKSLYLKIGKPNWRISMIGGFNHQVQWGGYPTKPFFDNISKQVISKFGNDFPTFLNTVTGVSLSKGGKGWDNQAGVAGNEAGNRSGNHLGTLDIGMELRLKEGRLLIYRQSIFDDGSLFYLNNISDGLFGVSFLSSKSQNFLKKITFEYLNTANQGGRYFFNQAPQLRGVDNYFNNGIYLDNWTYKNQTIGNSLFVPTSNLDLKNNSIENPNYLINNRVSAINLNVFYSYKGFVANSQIISSRNFGNYDYAIDKSQMHVKQNVAYFYKSLYYHISIASDFGELWPRATGLNIGVKKVLK